MLYEQSQTLAVQQVRSLINSFLKEGYYIKETRNGYCILRRPARVTVILSYENVQIKYNMKKAVCSIYREQHISQKLYDKFVKDVKSKKITFYIDDVTGNYSIKI